MLRVLGPEMVVRSDPKKIGTNAGCGDCFWTVQGWMFGDCFRQSKAEITGLLSDNSGLELGLFSNSPEPKYRGCF